MNERPQITVSIDAPTEVDVRVITSSPTVRVIRLKPGKEFEDEARQATRLDVPQTKKGSE